jgi:hypothetical protein
MDALAPRVAETTLARDPELVDETLAAVTRAERAISASCGRLEGDELALQMIVQQRRAGR